MAQQHTNRALPSIAVTFADHSKLLKPVRLPYGSEHLLNYSRKHFPDRRLAFVYEAGPTGLSLCDDLRAGGHPCLVVAPSMVPTPQEISPSQARLELTIPPKEEKNYHLTISCELGEATSRAVAYGPAAEAALTSSKTAADEHCSIVTSNLEFNE